ncbi:MAG: 3-phosphoglycerate dehydrogenase [Bacteroidaceae bacterium]|nr:3-phosphoglycerate dehydrogenase [Bacteroidaceae bacterium]
MKVLVATEKPFTKVAVDGIRKIVEEAGHELVLLENYTEKSQLLAAVAEVEAIIVRSDIVDAEVMAAAPKLQIVVRAGAGYDNVDLAAATERKVVVMNTPGQNANAVAELVFGMLIYHLRKRFSGKSGGELKGKKLGLLAYGHIGRCVARIAKGFGMDVQAYDFFNRVERIEIDGIKAATNRYAMVQECDIVSLHMPATPETKGSVNREFLELLKPNAILVNTARKELINEADLLEYLKERTDLSYLTDIRPAMHDEFEAALGDRYFSPPKKMGAQTAEANMNAGLAAADQICKFFATGCTTYQVNA